MGKWKGRTGWEKRREEMGGNRRGKGEGKEGRGEAMKGRGKRRGGEERRRRGRGREERVKWFILSRGTKKNAKLTNF